MRLKDKVAIITGAGSGMGQAAAILFAKEGAKVVVADIKTDLGEKTVNMVKDDGGEAIFIAVDVSKEKEVENMVDTTVKEYGKLDIIYNNAGIAPVETPFLTITEETWDRFMNINLKGTFFGCKYAIPIFKQAGKGVIINAAALAGILPSPGRSHYNSTKGGVILLTKSLAVEMAEFNIRVNAIAPGPTLTPMLQNLIDNSTEEFVCQLNAIVPLGRLIKPEDIAKTALFLASDESEMITGVILSVDGGMSAGKKG
ncbi:MAG: SDR family oxidoreductase [Deltaproteobacteria bacterium]|nr:SDR family oxidoreductase [Deltaproteobacteria bacterium]